MHPPKTTVVQLSLCPTCPDWPAQPWWSCATTLSSCRHVLEPHFRESVNHSLFSITASLELNLFSWKLTAGSHLLLMTCLAHLGEHLSFWCVVLLPFAVSIRYMGGRFCDNGQHFLPWRQESFFFSFCQQSVAAYIRDTEASCQILVAFDYKKLDGGTAPIWLKSW